MFDDLDLVCPINWGHTLNIGRVAWWLALPHAGFRGNTWRDLCGLSGRKPSNGTITTSGVTWKGASGRRGGVGSLSFGGVSGHVTTGLPTPTLPITFAFWCNPTSSTPVGIFDSAPSTVGTLRQFDVGQASWHSSDPIVTLGLSASVWQRVVLVYRFATNRKIDYYLNGVFVSTATGTTTNSFGWTTFTLGDINSGGVRYSGLLDDFSVYSGRSLSAAEVAADYDLSRRGYPGVLNRYAASGRRAS